MCFILNLSKGKFVLFFWSVLHKLWGKIFLWEAKAELEMYCGKARVRNVTLCSFVNKGFPPFPLIVSSPTATTGSLRISISGL